MASNLSVIFSFLGLQLQVLYAASLCHLEHGVFSATLHQQTFVHLSSPCFEGGKFKVCWGHNLKIRKCFSKNLFLQIACLFTQRSKVCKGANKAHKEHNETQSARRIFQDHKGNFVAVVGVPANNQMKSLIRSNVVRDANICTKTKGIFVQQKYLRESALNFALSIQSTSAKICGRQNFAFSRKGAKFAKAQIRSTKDTTKHKVHEEFSKATKGIFASEGSEAKISARILYSNLRLKHATNICENLRNLRETDFRFKHS
jgi:hypothetical protein